MKSQFKPAEKNSYRAHLARVDNYAPSDAEVLTNEQLQENAANPVQINPDIARLGRASIESTSDTMVGSYTMVGLVIVLECLTFSILNHIQILKHNPEGKGLGLALVGAAGVLSTVYLTRAAQRIRNKRDVKTNASLEEVSRLIDIGPVEITKGPKREYVIKDFTTGSETIVKPEALDSVVTRY